MINRNSFHFEQQFYVNFMSRRTKKKIRQRRRKRRKEKEGKEQINL